MDAARLGTFALLMLAGQFSPGPDMLLLLRNSLRYRLRAGLFTVLGISTGILIHVVVVLTALAATMKSFPGLFAWIARIGAAYLVYLGLKLLWSVMKPGGAEEGVSGEMPKLSDGGAFAQGFLTNITNVKAVVFFSSLLPAFLGPSPSPGHQWVYGGIIFGQAVVFWSLFVWLLQARRVARTYRKLERPINFTFGILLLMVAVQAFYASAHLT